MSLFKSAFSDSVKATTTMCGRNLSQADSYLDEIEERKAVPVSTEHAEQSGPAEHKPTSLTAWNPKLLDCF
jgi:hypothetical protein